MWYADAVVTHTRKARSAKRAAAAWLADADVIYDVSMQALASVKESALTVDSRTTVADVDADYPAIWDDVVAADAAAPGGGADAHADAGLALDAADGDPTDAGGTVPGDDIGLHAAIHGADDLEVGLWGDVPDPGPGAGGADAGGGAANPQRRAPADGPASATARDLPADEPTGTEGVFTTALGETARFDMPHRAALAVVYARRAHLHLLTLNPVTQKSAVPLPPRSTPAKATAAFEADLAVMAHGDGTAMLHDVRHVVEGTLPQVPARWTHLDGELRGHLRTLGMCLVWGCMQYAVGDYRKQSHLCLDHVGADVQVTATGEVMRLCTACKNVWPVPHFPAPDVAGKAKLVCKTCAPKAVRASRKRRARLLGLGKGVSAALEEPASQAAGPSEGVTVPFPQPSPAEVQAGLDVDGSYLADRRVAAMRGQ